MAILLKLSLQNPVIAGNYRYISLNDIVSNFMVSYVGQDKIIPRIKRNRCIISRQKRYTRI